jgi:hypothetical protein
MLIVKIVNTTQGTNENSTYYYTVNVNMREIASGHIEGHDRNNGWAVLLKQIAEQNMTVNPKR